jgi:hypothetical protein
MKNINFLSLAAVLAAALLLLSCKKEESTPAIDANKKGQIVLEFDNMVGKSDFTLNQEYTNAAGEKYQIDLLQYYVSNIRLRTEDGKEYVVPQEKSYFMVREHDKSTHEITLSDIPEGNYSEVSFILGIDSLRNTKEPSERTGVLDIAGEAKGMYWQWNSGYIFFKMEGISPAAPKGNDGQNRFRYHIGGFGGYSSRTINNIKKITLPFGTSRARVREGRKPSVHIVADLEKFFKGKTILSIAANSTVMFNPFSVEIANNYAEMFEAHHVHN